MYKGKLIIVLVLFLLILIPEISMANSLSLRSSAKMIEPGKTLTLSIYANSTSAKAFTAQANIDFPADLISIESFTFGSAWFPINQVGYDVIDNATGKLIKTAGYPNGFDNEILLGTLVIKSKKAGVVSFNFNKSSYILDMDSNNILTTYSSFSITSSSPEKVVTPPVTPPVIDKPVDKKPTTPKIEKPIEEKPIIDTVDPNIVAEEIRKRTLINNVFLLFNGALTFNEFFRTILGSI